MPHICCIWECGSGLGHLSKLKPFIDAALARGDTVTLVAKETHNVSVICDPDRIAVRPTPRIEPHTGGSGERIASFARLLRSYYGNRDRLGQLCRQWDALLDDLDPDLVICEHAPTALICCLERRCTVWTAGFGFTLPRTDQDYLGWFPGIEAPSKAELRLDTHWLLERINGYLLSTRRRPITSLAQLWTQAEREWLLTLPELDQFGLRPSAKYHGLPDPIGRGESAWPDRPGPKILGYLSDCPAMKPLLRALDGMAVNALIYSRDLDARACADFPALNITTTPVDFAALLDKADLVINMAGHMSAGQTYLASVPQLMLVRQQEQLLMARRIMAQHAGVAHNARSADISISLQQAFRLMQQGVPKARSVSTGRLADRIGAAFEEVV